MRVLRTALLLLEDREFSARSARIAVDYLTLEEVLEWAALVLAADSEERASSLAEHERDLARVTNARARETAFRMMRGLPCSREIQEKLWTELLAILKEVCAPGVAWDAVAVDLLWAFDTIFGPPVEAGHETALAGSPTEQVP